MGRIELELKTPGELLDEVVKLRKALERIQSVLRPADNARNSKTVGWAREIALAALNR